jgi:hypothetical protein
MNEQHRHGIPSQMKHDGSVWHRPGLIEQWRELHHERPYDEPHFIPGTLLFAAIFVVFGLLAAGWGW